MRKNEKTYSIFNYCACYETKSEFTFTEKEAKFLETVFHELNKYIDENDPCYPFICLYEGSLKELNEEWYGPEGSEEE